MSSNTSTYPVAISRISEDDSREAQNLRALRWLANQEGGPVVVVTPQKDFDGDRLKRLIKQPGVTQHTWRGFSVASLRGRRVVYCWPDRQHLNDLWDADPGALVVIEHGGGKPPSGLRTPIPSSFSRTRRYRLESRRRTQPRANRCRTALRATSSTSLEWRPGTRPGSSGTRRTC